MQAQVVLIRVAFAASVLIYLGLAKFLESSGSFPPGNAEQVKTLAAVLMVVYAVLVLVVAPRAGTSMNGFFIRLACYESGAIFGLVLFFLGGGLTYLVALGSLALLLILMRA